MPVMNLRKVGGSVAVVIPPNMLDSLQLSAGSSVNLAIEKNAITIKPIAQKPKYSLQQLLANSDYDAIQADRQAFAHQKDDWINDPAVGNELL